MRYNFLAYKEFFDRWKNFREQSQLEDLNRVQAKITEEINDEQAMESNVEDIMFEHHRKEKQMVA